MIVKWDLSAATPVGVCIIGAILSSLGMVLQKVAHLRCKKAKKSYVTQLDWLLGFFVYASGDFTLFVTLCYLPQAVVAVLGTWTLIANCGFATCLLNERLTAADIAATVLIFLGTTLALSSYNPGKQQYTEAELTQLANQPSFQLFTSGIMLLLLSTLIWLLVDAQPRHILVRVAEFGAQHRNRSRSFSYTLAASICNTLAILLGKCIASLVSEAALADAIQDLTSSSFFELALTCAVVCVLNVHLVNKALQSGDALFVVPLYFVMGLSFKVVSGLIFFQDYLYMTQTEIIIFAGGCLVNIVGVYVLSQHGIDKPFPPSPPPLAPTTGEQAYLVGAAATTVPVGTISGAASEAGVTLDGGGSAGEDLGDAHDVPVIHRVNSMSLFGFSVCASSSPRTRAFSH